MKRIHFSVLECQMIVCKRYWKERKENVNSVGNQSYAFEVVQMQTLFFQHFGMSTDTYVGRLTIEQKFLIVLMCDCNSLECIVLLFRTSY